MDCFVQLSGRTLRVRVEGDRVTVDGTPIDVELAPSRLGSLRNVRIGERSLRLVATRNGRGWWLLELNGIRHDVRVMDPGEERLRLARGAAAGKPAPSLLRAPMPGLVVRVEVAEGEVVQEGQAAVRMEAMKMENELRVAREGRVRRVLVAPGDAVERDQVLVELEPVDGEEG